MKVGSLFSGIGGLDLGLQRAGMEVRWQVENDPYCQRVLAKHWPNVPCYGDIREVRGADLEPVDVICGGFPCQPTSHAGRRRGEEDDRWLWPEMLRLIREVEPAYVVGENVFGLVTHNGGLLLASIVADLEAEGFEVSPPVVFPAAGVGAWHKRDRVWIVAHSNYGHVSKKPKVRARRNAAGPQGADVPDAEGFSRPLREAEREQPWRPTGCGDAADPHGNEYEGGSYALGRSPATLLSANPNSERGRRWDHEREDAADAWQLAGSPRVGYWDVEPAVGRVAHGVPHRVDRLKSLGNAVVPQCAELIGRHLMAVLS